MHYVIHYRLDDKRQTPGRCKADYALTPGDLIYAKEGRAIVRSCRLEQSRDATFQRNARALGALTTHSEN
jgi:hypothetical protein